MVIDLLDEILEVQEAPAAQRANKALKEWASQGAQAPAPVPEAPEGQCQVCRSRPARRRCRGCERPVCASDLWTMFGLCTDCASEDRVRRWHQEGRPSGANWLDGA